MCVSKHTLEMVLEQRFANGRCTKYIATPFQIISIISYVHILAVA